MSSTRRRGSTRDARLMSTPNPADLAATASAWAPWTAAFAQRLRELGWMEGRNLAIEYRWAEGRSERFEEIATEFVRLKVDVVVTGGNAAIAVKRITSAIPI